MDDETLIAYCLAWQWEWEKAYRKASLFKDGRVVGQTHGTDQRNWNPNIQEEIYARLDKTVQSSALVECINSIIIPYFNTSKNQISQEQLNLIIHYHSHHR